VLGQADIVSLHLPSTPQTRHLIDADRLGGMRPEALLVNTARGAVLDEIALYDALAAGKLGGAGLDVFENEPYRPAAPGKDLRTLSQVVLTPHVASNTREANDRMARAALANVAGFFEGRIHELSRVELPKT
jgi:phosphoglycerate dehydrogenase-like enzyme